MTPGGAPTIDAPCPRHPHLPATFACARCGSFGCPTCAVATTWGPICMPCAAKATSGVMPGTFTWEEREAHGPLGAFFKTAWSLSVKPKATWPFVPKDGPLGDATLFSFLSCVLDYALWIPLFVLVGIVGVLDDSGPKELDPIPFTLGGILGVVAWMAVAAFVVNPLVAVLEHAALKLFGATGTLRETYRAVCYSQAPGILGTFTALVGMGCCVPTVSPFWQRFVRARAYEAHFDVSYGAALAVVWVIPIVGFAVAVTAVAAATVFYAGDAS